MSLILHPPHSLISSTSFSEEKDTAHAVVLSEELWDHLTFNQDGRPDRLAVSLAIPRLPDTSSVHRAIICWATPASTGSTHGVVVPASWKARYTAILSNTVQSLAPSTAPEIYIVQVQPVLLTQIFVIALSKPAFDLAQQRPSNLEEWLSQNQRILRLGDRHACTFLDGHLHDYQDHADILRYEYEIAMNEPVLQGYAQLGMTRFFVLPSRCEEGEHIQVPSVSEADHRHCDTRDECYIECGSSDSAADSDEAFEIDENFLASSTLRTLTFSSYSHDPSGSNYPVKDKAFHRDRSSSENGSSSHDGSLMLHSASTFFAQPSLQPIDPQYDANCTIFVRTADLGKTGLFNGDWAIVCALDSTDYRLVRVLIDDNLIRSVDTAIASPLLLHNILPAKMHPEGLSLLLRASPFGARTPSVPTAKTATLARIASPVSTDRSFQPLFLRVLKAHFDGTKRIVKKGDIIAVTIDTDSAYEAQEVDESLEEIDDFNPDDLINHGARLEGGTPNAVVFFLITNLEHDVVKGTEEKGCPDSYVGSTMGELGCWIDFAMTRIIQAGVEHSLVPPMATFLGLDCGPPLRSLDLYDDDTKNSFASRPVRRLYDLASVSLRPKAADYDLCLSVLLKGARGTGKYTAACRVAQRLGMHVLDVNCYDVIGETDVKTEGTLRARFDKAISCSPCVLLLRNIDALAQKTQVLEAGKEPSIVTALRECLEQLPREWKLSDYPVLAIATTSDAEKIPSGVLSCFKQEISFKAPGESERLEILVSLLQDAILAPDLSLKAIATQTAALVAADLKDLIFRTRQGAVKRVSSLMKDYSEVDIAHAGVSLTGADFDTALGKARASYSQSIGAPKIPSVSWDDVGGLASVKADILDTIQLPLEHPEMFMDGLKKRSGILLYGPPGTGKTLLAKAVATSCSLNFFSVKGPELLNMYIGESEANVRRVFQRARDAKPCVIFFDELDSIAPKRGNHGDSGGVMDRIVSQILAELDGMSDGKGGADVFVIGATNRPDLLDPALLRPGRFDRMLYLGVSDTHDAQLNILAALTRKFHLHPELNLRDVADQCPFNYTGADFYALCSDAMLKAMSRKAEEIEEKIATLNKAPPLAGHAYPITPQYYLSELASSSDTDVLVSRADFEIALRELIPSVSKSEMNHYSSVQRRFAGETLNSKVEGGGNDAENSLLLQE